MNKICPLCNNIVSAQNYSRHVARCNGNGFSYYVKQIPPEVLDCKYCGKLCKNLNSLRQHECRCKQNPDRRNFDNFTTYIVDNVKGQTVSTCDSVKKQVETIKKKYADGYVNPNKGRKVEFEYVYKDHNDAEINKWLQYIDTINIPQKDYLTTYHFWGYLAIARIDDLGNVKSTNLFEHIYLANILLDGNLVSTNAVHHINKNKTDNSITNLMVFIDKNSHKRFHNSKYAYLTYDESTHLFSCELRK